MFTSFIPTIKCYFPFTAIQLTIEDPNMKTYIRFEESNTYSTLLGPSEKNEALQMGSKSCRSWLCRSESWSLLPVKYVDFRMYRPDGVRSLDALFCVIGQAKKKAFARKNRMVYFFPVFNQDHKNHS